MNLSATKAKIIKNIVVSGTLQGALSRNSIYDKNATMTERKEFREFLSKELPVVLNGILSKAVYNDNDHYRTVVAFSNKISRNKKIQKCLLNGRLRIGTSQKLINLYWKMSWLLLPKVKSPIHCPFDRIIIRELDRSVHHINWTQSDKIEDYKYLVSEARKKVSGRITIAEWELETYGLNTIVDIE